MKHNKNFKNILLSWTDCPEDLIFLKLVVQALRASYPGARVSLLLPLSSEKRLGLDVLLDRIIFYDLKGRHKGFIGFWRLVLVLCCYQFDLAINYRSKKKIHWLLFHAAIRYRAGYQSRQGSFLLTHQYPRAEISLEKNTQEYFLNLLRNIGICPVGSGG